MTIHRIGPPRTRHGFIAALLLSILLPTRGHAAAPDLIVDAIAVTPRRLIEPSTLAVVATIANAGDATATATTARLRIDFGDDGSWDVALSEPSRRTQAGASTRQLWRDATVAAAGRHRLEVCLDVENAITEADEGNNCTTTTVVVGARTRHRSAPDLSIQALTVRTSPVTGDGRFTIKARVQNDGSPAAASTARLRIDAGADGSFESTPPPQSVPALRAGAGRLVSWTTPTALAAGRHRLELCADAGNGVGESDEANNCVESLFVLGGGQ